MIWFRKAAEQDHPVAKLYLGVMYAEGRGVPQDYVRAYMWFSLSAAQGEQTSGQDSRHGRAEDDPSSDSRSAETRTRLTGCCVHANPARARRRAGFIRKDTHAILSYTHDGDIFSI